MKKQYISPTIYFHRLKRLEILCGSPSLDYANDNSSEVDPTAEAKCPFGSFEHFEEETRTPINLWR